MGVTPEDIRTKLFRTVRLQTGYEQAEVDELLDALDFELCRLTGVSTYPGATPPSGPSAGDVLAERLSKPPGSRFTQVRLREGYHTASVDDFLAEVAAALDQARRR